ncbi:swi5-dependent recombination DNA repair protein 1 homolog [Homalodisca vitripennis]|uniref:swi5-dependent recombination DNA repair protein 1 homolog n=1 Tax=Homalodisca vitripennis TaxID=197043 RepID=UPI001EEA662C|nr:swi5-dependent recombination DNA repair protein 1 homolog [Homalodisca vitripennis]
MRSLLSPLPRAVTSPASSAPHTPPAVPAAICSTPDPDFSPKATPSLPAAPTTPTAVAPAGSPPCAAVGTPDPPTPSTQCPYQLLLENQALNQKIFDLQEQMKVILDHSKESDQRLLEYTDQVFVARPSVNVSTSSSHAKNKYCQATDSFTRSCERCPILEEEVQNMLTTTKTLEEEIKTLKNEKLLPFEKLNSDSRARHLSSMMRAGVDGVTNVCGTCKPGAGLLNTIPDAAPPPDNCFILISANNDVAAGRAEHNLQ